MTVYCEARGVYRPTVVWMKDNEIIQNSSRVTIQESVGTDDSIINSTITIDTFSRSNVGVYICIGANTAGSDQASFVLTIEG